MNVSVSVIIPVYNVEKHLAACIESVIGSCGFDEYELLLADDGSADGSADIIASYASRCGNIRALSYELPPYNRGVSAARNLGLREASGEYVFFLDSDDLIAPDYLSLLLKTAKDKRCDIVYSGFSIIDNGEIVPCKRELLMYSGTESGKSFLERKRQLGDKYNYIWCALYRRDFLTDNSIGFDEEILIYEDTEFTPRAALAAERVCTADSYGYIHRCRRNSLVGELRRRDVDWVMTVIEKQLAQALATDDAESRILLLNGLYPSISKVLYYIGRLSDTGVIDSASKRAYIQKLKALLPWRTLRSGALSVKDKIKWLIWRTDLRLFYPLVKKDA